MNYFKLIMSDVGLMQAMINDSVSQWVIDPAKTSEIQGNAAEAFVGQEIVANSSPLKKYELFYWARTKKGANAEIDYLIEASGGIIPVEVKAGKSYRMVSMEIYLKEKPQIEYGIHFSPGNNRRGDKIVRLPIYLAGSITGNWFTEKSIQINNTTPFTDKRARQDSS